MQVSVEGNIASGKSTILNMFRKYKDVEVCVRTVVIVRINIIIVYTYA